jgi:hypothetical protein
VDVSGGFGERGPLGASRKNDWGPDADCPVKIEEPPYGRSSGVSQRGPNFFIVGATKAATTSLSSLLEAHPQAAIVRFKEPHFFSFDDCYAEGWSKYLELFAHVSDETAIGDASTSYSRLRYHPRVIRRIQRHVPDAKIIYMVRHPIERMESAYLEYISREIIYAVRYPIERMESAYLEPIPNEGGMAFTSINDAIRRNPMIVDSSRYWEVFDAYRKAFGEDRIRIVWFEEYIANQKAVFQDVCQFLEIDDQCEPNLTVEGRNSREDAALRLARTSGDGGLPWNMVWEEDLRRQVIAQIHDDNLRFLAHFGRPANYWGDLF